MSGLRCPILAQVALLVGVSAALAQTPLKPWPDQQPQQAQPQQAWPGESPRQTSAPPAMAPMAPMAPQMGAPMGGQPQGAPGPNPCVAEFTRLRGEVEKKGAVAKAVNDRKGTREEMCSAVTGIHAAQVTWVKYTVDHATQCGIPADAIKQLRMGQDNLAKLRKNVCSGGGTAAAPAAPSLSEALGTSTLPPSSSSNTSDAPRKRGGVLDSMTGTPIR